MHSCMWQLLKIVASGSKEQRDNSQVWVKKWRKVRAISLAHMCRHGSQRSWFLCADQNFDQDVREVVPSGNLGSLRQGSREPSWKVLGPSWEGLVASFGDLEGLGRSLEGIYRRFRALSL